MRIIAGRFKGTALASPTDLRIRPTSDRVRESMFNILEYGCGVAFEGARVLDLFAGTGALGLEAMSRGAAYGLFVEDAAEARGLIRTNMDSLGIAGITKIYRRDATKLYEPGTHAPFDIVFVDPPYGQGLGERAIASALASGWLTDDAVLVLEESKQSAVTLPDGVHQVDHRTYGDTQVFFLQVGDASQADADR